MILLFRLFDWLRQRAGWALLPAAAVALAACQVLPSGAPVATPQAGAPADQPERLMLAVDDAWGGQARCASDGRCRVAAVGHMDDTVSVYELRGRSAHLLGRHDVAHHPDSAVWLDDDTFVAAVEVSRSLDVFRLHDGGIAAVGQIPLDFAPRTVRLLPAEGDSSMQRLLAAPYGGPAVNYIEWPRGAAPAQAAVATAKWCGTPWYPAMVTRAPGHAGPGIAVACYDDRRIVWVPQSDPLAPVSELATLRGVPRQVAPSPAGRWLYVASELYNQNARIDMDSGRVQMLANPESSAFSVAPLAEDRVVWGADLRLILQQFDAAGHVTETRWLPAAGFVEALQLIDLDGDGERDLVVFGAEEGVEIVFGPLWEQASAERPEVTPPWAR